MPSQDPDQQPIQSRWQTGGARVLFGWWRNRGRVLILLAVLVAVAAAVVAGYSFATRDRIPADQRIVPAAVPAGWEEQRFENVSVATPGGLEQSTGRNAEYDATMHNFQTKRNDSSTQGDIQVMVVDAPQRSAEEAVNAIETGYRATTSIENVEKEEIVWPGTETAWLLSFTANVPDGTGGRIPHTTQYMILDLRDGRQVHAAVTALAEEFEWLRLADVLATVRAN